MKKNIAIFAFDIGEISQIRRIESFIRLGFNVTSFSMRRKNMNMHFVPNWPNVHLFQTENEKPIKRIFTIIFSWVKLCFYLKTLAKSDTIIARNFDMLLIAFGAKVMLYVCGKRKNIYLVYECLDIHSFFCSKGIRGQFARFIERVALKFTNRIIVSSPAFKDEYFKDIQNFSGEIRVIENKLISNTNKRSTKSIALKPPIKIGLVGTIRCAPSVGLLLELAEKYPETFEVHFYGIVHKNTLPMFERDVEKLRNAHMHGAYDYYRDLKEIYQNLNFVWAQDLWQTNGNSMWLLPNRIYEAGYYGCPSIALSHSETGRKISKMCWGICVDDIHADILASVIRNLTNEGYEKLRQGILNTPSIEFIQNDADLRYFFESDGASS